MQAILKYIVVDKVREAKTTVVGGLEFTEKQNVDIRYVKGVVISAGSLSEGLVKEGDIVWYDKNAGHGIPSGDQLYYVINIGDIVVVE